MNQYEVFERELAQYFTEELQNSKAFSEMQYFADTEQIYKKQSPVTFFSNLQKGLGNLISEQASRLDAFSGYQSRT